jgi:hypothetical protein
LIRIEPILVSASRAFVSDQITNRQDRDRQVFNFDDLPLLISVIESDAAYGGDYIDPPGRDTTLEDDARSGKRSLVNLVERGTKCRH